MLQQRGLIQLSLASTILLGLLVGIYPIVWKLSSKPDPAEGVAKHSVNKSADDVLKYWTADKKRKAKPAPMPNVPAHDQEKPKPQPRPKDS